MDQMTHEAHGQAADPHAGMKMSGAHGSHDRHAGHSVAMFRDKFWLSFALTIPVVIWAKDVQHWLGYTAPSFPGSKFIPAILGTVLFVYGGLVFIRVGLNADDAVWDATVFRTSADSCYCGSKSANTNPSRSTTSPVRTAMGPENTGASYTNV